VTERPSLAVVSEAHGTSGANDYARLLGEELARRGYNLVRGEARVDVAVYNHAPYAAGVSLGWLRGARGARRARRRSRTLVVVLHEVFAQPDDRLRMRAFTRAQRWSFRRIVADADAVVLADEARAAALARLVPGAGEPTVIPVGPNIPVPAALPPRADTETVLTFGLLQAGRDLETVVRAAAALARARPNAQVVVAGDLSGDPARLAGLRALARELSAPVELTGELSDAAVAERFAEARAFVTAYTESVSLGSGTLAAALAYALPVVAFESAQLHPALRSGENVLTSPRDPDALAETLADALGERGGAVGAAGRALYERELAWPRIADRFEELLASVAHAHG
jgi:glycosyltransferase involved in cell wall biosynthesis